MRYGFGRLGKDLARGLTVRTDWGPQYTAHAFGAELRWLGIQHSPSFVGEPQCNGVIERFMRTLKEQCLWLQRFTDLAHAEREIGAFIERYNQEWLVERHDNCRPRAIREPRGGGVSRTGNCPENPDRYTRQLPPHARYWARPSGGRCPQRCSRSGEDGLARTVRDSRWPSGCTSWAVCVHPSPIARLRPPDAATC